MLLWVMYEVDGGQWTPLCVIYLRLFLYHYLSTYPRFVFCSSLWLLFYYEWFLWFFVWYWNKSWIVIHFSNSRWRLSTFAKWFSQTMGIVGINRYFRIKRIRSVQSNRFVVSDGLHSVGVHCSNVKVTPNRMNYNEKGQMNIA